MKKIVKGNDFTLRIPVAKMVDGDQVAFPLPACTDLAVRIVNAYRRINLNYTIDASADNVLLARVEGDALAVGVYALEVRGKIFGNDWRSNEYEQFQIVDNNASADTSFDGELIEGEDSVEMNTAIVFFPPDVNLSLLIDDVDAAIKKVNDTTEAVTQTVAKVVDTAVQATADAVAATKTATKQADRAKAIADHPNIIGDDGYWMRWDETTGEYVRTEHYSRGTFDYPTFDVDTDTMELAVSITDGSDERYALTDDGELVINQNLI